MPRSRSRSWNGRCPCDYISPTGCSREGGGRHYLKPRRAPESSAINPGFRGGSSAVGHRRPTVRRSLRASRQHLQHARLPWLWHQRLGEPHRFVEPGVERLARDPQSGGGLLAREPRSYDRIEPDRRLPQRLEVLAPGVVKECAPVLRRQVCHAEDAVTCSEPFIEKTRDRGLAA